MYDYVINLPYFIIYSCYLIFWFSFFKVCYCAGIILIICNTEFCYYLLAILWNISVCNWKSKWRKIFKCHSWIMCIRRSLSNISDEIRYMLWVLPHKLPYRNEKYFCGCYGKTLKSYDMIFEVVTSILQWPLSYHTYEVKTWQKCTHQMREFGGRHMPHQRILRNFRNIW